MKKAKSEGREAYISVDKLYIDGTLYVSKPDESAMDTEPAPQPTAGTGINPAQGQVQNDGGK